jgi:cytochrome c oxidase subunit III
MEIPYTKTPRPDTGLYNAKVGIWLFLASEVMLFGALFSSYILLRVGADPGTWPHGLLNVPIGTFNTGVLIASSVTVVMAWASLKMGKFSHFKVYQGITVLCALAFLVIKSFEYHDKWVHYEIWKQDGSRMTGHIHTAEGKSPMFWNTKRLAGSPEVKDAKSGAVLRAAVPPVTEFEFTPDAHHYAAPKEHHAGKEGKHAAHGEKVTVKSSELKRLSAFVPAHSTYFAIYFTLTALHALHVLGGAIVIGYLWGPGSAMWKTNPEQFTNRVEVSGLFWHFVDLVWIFLFPVLYLL